MNEKNERKMYRGIIYKYTFPNGKVYIGQTTNPKARKSSHFNDKYGKRNVTFWRAYEKYGTYEYEEIDSAEDETKEGLREKLNILEQQYIADYKSNERDFGYNLTSGGDVFIVNEEGRKHMSEARTDKLPVLQYDLNGDFVTEYESLVKAGKAVGSSSSNIWNCCVGKHTGRRKKKAQICKGFTFRFKKDYPDVPSHIDLTITTLEKKVLQFSTDGKFIKEWDSIIAASIGTNCHESGIRQCCYGKYRQCSGFMWRLRDEFDVIPSCIEPIRKKVKRPFPKLTDEQVEKGKQICRERFSKPVIQFEKDGKFVKEYPSCTSAAKAFNVKKEMIINACKHEKTKTCKGYQWRYKTDVDDPIKGIEPFKLTYSEGPKRRILQYSVDGEFIKEWDCIKDATRYYNVCKTALNPCLSGKRQTSIGFIWKYKDNSK